MATDATAPALTGVTLLDAPDAHTLTFIVTFDEAVQSVNADDFRLTTTGTANGAVADVSLDNGTSFVVTVNNTSGSGTLRLDVKSATDVQDVAGNAAGPYTSSTAVQVPPDIRLTSVATDGTANLVLSYEILGCLVAPFEIGFYRSLDTVFGGDTITDGMLIDGATDRALGTHTKVFTIGGGVGEVALPGAGAAGFGTTSTLAFLFDGGSGTNTAKVWGATSTTTKDVAKINPMSASISGLRYTLSLAGMRGMTVTSQGGPDEAYIYDSSLNDTFTAYPTYVTLSNSLYTNRAEGFRNVFAYAQVGGAYMPAGGNDVAYFYGIDGTRDYFRASAMYGIMSDAEATRGKTYFVRGNWFEEVHAYGRQTSGRPSSVDRDQAMLFDAATPDLFEAETTTALATYAYTGASRVDAHAFRVVKAYGAPGDIANLYGPGTYTPGANPVMYTGDFTVWANGFNPLNWHSSGRPAAPASHGAAVDAALPLFFADDPSTLVIRKKVSPSIVDLALVAD